VAGPRAAEIAAIESLTSFGRQSVFQYLHDNNAKQLLIGCGYHDGVAQFHWLEETREVPYRFWKKFEGEVVLNGQHQHRAFFMYARRLDLNVGLNTEPLAQEFERTGHVSTTDVGACRLRAFDLRAFDDFCGARVAADPLVMLTAECRALFRPRPHPVKRIDHIGIVSRYSNKIRSFLSLVQCEPKYEGLVEELGVNCQYYEGYNVKLEFVDPTRPDSRVSHHAQKNPTCPLHHIAFEVDNMEEALQFFKAKGYLPLDGRFHLGPTPYQRVIFLSPVLTGGLLVELVCNDAHNHPAYKATE
jgi:catechol 2,3-dioxygenase-like lactoylglutathione lyase family enzyme